MSDEGGCLLALAVLGGIVLLVIAIVTNVGWVGPDTFVGYLPDVHHSYDCTTSGGGEDGGGSTSCTYNARETTIVWTLAPGGGLLTRLSATEGDPTPETFHEMDGTLTLLNGAGCPAAVRATLRAGPGPDAPPVTLTADQPDASPSDMVPVPDAGAQEIRIELQRMDSAGCPATVEWTRASLK